MNTTFKAKELAVELSTFAGDFAWLHAYWSERADHAGMADWTAIKLVEFPSTILPWLVVMDVVEDERAFVFRYWGTERTNLQGVDMTGRSVKELKIPGLADAMLHQNERAVAARAPILFLNRFETPSGVPVQYEALRLPVTEGGEQVAKVLALSRFIDEQEYIERHETKGPTPI